LTSKLSNESPAAKLLLPAKLRLLGVASVPNSVLKFKRKETDSLLRLERLSTLPEGDTVESVIVCQTRLGRLPINYRHKTLMIRGINSTVPR